LPHLEEAAVLIFKPGFSAATGGSGAAETPTLTSTAASSAAAEAAGAGLSLSMGPAAATESREEVLMSALRPRLFLCGALRLGVSAAEALAAVARHDAVTESHAAPHLAPAVAIALANQLAFFGASGARASSPGGAAAAAWVVLLLLEVEVVEVALAVRDVGTCFSAAAGVLVAAAAAVRARHLSLRPETARTNQLALQAVGASAAAA
jgi:hypothetical protein